MCEPHTEESVNLKTSLGIMEPDEQKGDGIQPKQLHHTTEWTNTKIPGRKEVWKGTELLWLNNDSKFPIWRKDRDLQIREYQQIPNRIGSMNSTPTHIKIKLEVIRAKEQSHYRKVIFHG